MNDSIYEDENGYYRYKYDSTLVHRKIAYNEIYLKNPDDYSLPFIEYSIHHKNGDKKDNRVKNLQIVTQDEHDSIHGYKEVYNKPIRMFLGIALIISIFIIMPVSFIALLNGYIIGLVGVFSPVIFLMIFYYLIQKRFI